MKKGFPAIQTLGVVTVVALIHTTVGPMAYTKVGLISKVDPLKGKQCVFVCNNLEIVVPKYITKSLNE